MDEFSWFVGIFEGEGCIQRKKVKTTHTLVTGEVKTYESDGTYITIRMTDEDTIARCASFLGVSYKPVKSYNSVSKKQLYQVRKMGSAHKGKLRDLVDRMYPHLSTRRQGQVDHACYK